jgi:hydrogenase expression/formation protein HypC
LPNLFYVLFCFKCRLKIIKFGTDSMCLAVPSKIIEINDFMAKVDVDGVVRDASIMLIDNAKVGEYVIVHAGFAINKLDEKAALQTIEDLRKILAADTGHD